VKSWEVLREAIERIGVKGVASRLNLSSALVYKWCQATAAEEPDGSGALNPLDRLRVICELTRDVRLVNWLCGAAGGFYVANPCVDPAELDEELLEATQRVVNDFGQLLTDVSQSIENDGQITTGEAERIRRSWEDLKSQAESFVVGCERGLYQQRRAK
jgi:hypothetical protein